MRDNKENNKNKVRRISMIHCESDSALVVIDPGHPNFGQVGRMTSSGQRADGKTFMEFGDGREVSLDTQWNAGITQFYPLFSNETDRIEQLVAVLPAIKPRLRYLFSQVVAPSQHPPTTETVMANARVLSLISVAINPLAGRQVV